MLASFDLRRHRSGGPPRSAVRPPRERRHASAHLDDRSVLEQDGWRTTLEYHENHRRGPDGVLSEVSPRWRGDAERWGSDGGVIVLSVVGSTPFAVWRRLRREAEAGAVDAVGGGPEPLARR